MNNLANPLNIDGLEPVATDATSHRAFVTTQWSLVDRAASDDDGSADALARICQAYWAPLFVFAQKRGADPDSAKDLTQAFLADFLLRNGFARATQSMGRFRSFLVKSFENFLHNQWRKHSAQKRGGGAIPCQVNGTGEHDTSAVEPASSETPSDAYDRQWATVVLDRMIRTVHEQWAAQGRSELCREFLCQLWGDSTSIPYPDLAVRFQLSEGNLRVMFHRFRHQCRDVLRRTVAETVADESEIDDELRHLMRAVSR